MFENINNIRITGVVFGNSTPRAKITNRPSHTLIYKISGESVYHLRGNTIHLSEGTVLYIPEGETFHFEKISEGESSHCLINFHASFPTAQEPHLFSPHASENVFAVYKQMESRYQFSSDESDRCEMLSIFFHLLSILLRSKQSAYLTTIQKNRLNPALQYLEAHLFDHNLQIRMLSDLCDMSEVTFRSLFSKRFGESPKKYIIRHRLLQAKAIMDSGEYTSIADVARRVGYEDPLYFSKQFKSFFGNSPSEN